MRSDSRPAPAGLVTGLVTGFVLLLALAGCSSTSDPGPPDQSAEPSVSTPMETPAPDPGPRPKVGECHTLTWQQALAPVTAANSVKCSTRHTAQTYFVGRLDLAPDGKALAVDAPSVQKQAQRTCTTRLPGHLGVPPRDLRLTMAQAVWFTPSVETAAAGADWVRCDVVVVSAPKKLQPLPRRTKGWGKAPAIAMCATAEPGTRRSTRVTCGSTHSWVAVSTVDLPGKKLPRAKQIQAQMDPVCREAARSRAEDPLDFTWSQESPTPEQWTTGQRYGICWLPS